MPRRTRKELAAENAVLVGKLEQLRDELDDFLSDDGDDDDRDGDGDELAGNEEDDG